MSKTPRYKNRAREARNHKYSLINSSRKKQRIKKRGNMDSMKIIKRGVNKQLEIIRSLSLHRKPLSRPKKVKTRGGKREKLPFTSKERLANNQMR